LKSPSEVGQNLYLFNNVRVSRNEKSMLGKMFTHFPLNDKAPDYRNKRTFSTPENFSSNFAATSSWIVAYIAYIYRWIVAYIYVMYV